MPSTSSPARPLVCLARKLPALIEKRLGELFEVELNETDKRPTRQQLEDMVRRADVLVPTVTETIDAALLAKASPALKLVANYGAGYDHIDVEKAARQNIIVTNTPDVLTQDTADMTMALILAVRRRILEGALFLQNNHENWPGWSPTSMLGHRLCGKRLGIVGMGRIGQAVAKRATGFNLGINYHNRHRVPKHIEEDLQATYWESLDQMLASMDIVSVNCPYTPATYHLLSARRLRLMKTTACIINTSRGEIIDEAELVRLLETGHIAGAGLDVYENEPNINPALLSNPHVVALPHMGSATLEARIDTGDAVLINIKAFLDGHTPPGRILPKM